MKNANGFSYNYYALLLAICTNTSSQKAISIMEGMPVIGRPANDNPNTWRSKLLNYESPWVCCPRKSCRSGHVIAVRYEEGLWGDVRYDMVCSDCEKVFVFMTEAGGELNYE